MNEIRRILSNRRRRLILLAAPLLCLALFLYEKSGGNFLMLKSGAEEYRTLLKSCEGMTPQEAADVLSERDPLVLPTEEERRLKAQAIHVREYDDYLKNVQEQAEKQKKSPLFGKNKNSFVYRNILKTAEEFDKMTGTKAVLGNDRAVESLIAFSGADYFFLAVMMLIAMSFFDEQKSGLQAVVRSCPAGRTGLGLKRCGVLLFFSALYTLLLYGLPLFGAFAIDGSGDLSRSVQSLVSFKKCTAHLTVSGWLIRMLLLRVLCGFLLGLIIWFFLSFLKQLQLMWLLTVLAFSAEYVLWRTIPVQSVFSPLKIINVFSYVHASELYTDYININLAGWPVGKRPLLLILLPALILIFSAACVRLQSRRYPFGNRDVLGKLVLFADRIGDAFRRHWPRFVFEGSKWLILSGSALFLLAAGWLTRDLTYDSGAYYSADKQIDRMYLQELTGPVGDETEAYLQKAHDALEEYYGDRSGFEGSLERVTNRIAALWKRAEEEGFEAWILDDTLLRNYLDRGAWETTRQNGLIAMACLVICLAALFAMEQTNGMKRLLMSTARGRGGTFGQKYALAFIMTLLAWAFVCGREVLRLLQIYPAEVMKISCHNLDLFLELPASLSFGGALALYFAGSFLAMLTVTHLCLYFSEIGGSGEKVMALGGVFLLLPAAAYSLGVNWLSPLTPLTFLADDHLLLATGPKRLLFLLWFIMSLLLLRRVRRKWTRC